MSGLFDLRGKTALVTGGSSGIGLGFARGIAKQGGDVMLWARSADRLEAAKSDLEQYGGRVAIDRVDVSSERAIVDGYADAIGEMGRIDCVFANAGSTTPVPSVLDLDGATFRAMLATSLEGAFYTLREGARHMVERAEAGDRGGSLVACGSLALFYGLVGGVHYAAAKAGVAAIVRAMASELGPYGIRANVVAPGYFKTGLTADVPNLEEIEAGMVQGTPMRRLGDPVDIEGVAAYLASHASSYHTGDTLVIDGGHLVQM